VSQQYDIVHGQPQQHAQTTTASASSQFGAIRRDAGQLPQQYRRVLDAVAQSVAVCGWCADQCIGYADPNMVECIRRCEDVVEMGEALLAVAPRSSHATPDLVSAFVRAANACARECGSHSLSHCQECATVLPWAAQSVQELFATGGRQPSGQQGQFGQWEQPAGQPTW